MIYILQFEEEIIALKKISIEPNCARLLVKETRGKDHPLFVQDERKGQ